MTYRLQNEDGEKFVRWLLNRVIHDARGDNRDSLEVAPVGRFWLGRLAPEIRVEKSKLGKRTARIEPCEAGFRLRLNELDGRPIKCRAQAVAWRKVETERKDPNAERWHKSDPVAVEVDLQTPRTLDEIQSAGRKEFEAGFTRVGASGLACEIRAELERGKQGPELVITLVNVSSEELEGWDTTVYEARLEASVGPTERFVLDDLDDSFRYDRTVAAYGVNSGVEDDSGIVFRTTDVASYDQPRPEFWDHDFAGASPGLAFATLAEDPIPAMRRLVAALERWGDRFWSEETLEHRAAQENWSISMKAFAFAESKEFSTELDRIRQGLHILENDPNLLRAFKLANRSFCESPVVKHTGWRTFQLGFFLCNIASLAPSTAEREREFVDTLWFPTGGGKTETYLLFVLVAAFHDRLRGKIQGITSWARFPLRMLSLQQTQRFMDVIAAAELVRRRENIPGHKFSVGFLVGKQGTPNKIPSIARPGDPNPDDPSMPGRYRVLLRCPFCGSEQLEMEFDRTQWILNHRCRNAGCVWGNQPLPFRIVDDEIYRTLPTVVLGTLDKAASVSWSAQIRGFYGAPYGTCPDKHGFTYAPRSGTEGCLYPGCNKKPRPLSQDEKLFAPTIRMQDELHLLRDSLGAVDSHYEALLDGLQAQFGESPKIITSSATLVGHERQTEMLYRRAGRTFPLPGPRAGHSFWLQHSDTLARCFAGLAPRGVTLEYATDQLCESLQEAVRKAVEHPEQVAEELSLEPERLPALISAYGTDVVYGTTLKDVEAAARSFESQIRISPVRAATLTGRTPLEDVRGVLACLNDPENDFYERIHLIAASSMLSHGVDIERLNVMVMLGLPLSTAEFIQTTSRVGRRYPGLVIVLHKIGRERDAAVFRSFPSFARHAERLIDPVPITAKSRRVLELTFAGLIMGRILGIHEPAALAAGLKQLTTAGFTKKAFAQLPVLEEEELKELIRMLSFTGALDSHLRQDLRNYVREFFRALNDPAVNVNFTNELLEPHPPMSSLRDVEKQAPIYSRGGQ
ncbi:helicase C-terminal domain-containing protein [Nonomuraea sp. NPDC048916]|uniref:helicase C-terminal domain-containing protein n=1 Tax=Nonomuraea sp. NPDC048916 TaxID=3154232 RepID=UPI00340C1127